MNKTQKILELWAKGKNRQEIAAVVGCSLRYANVVRWRAERPGYDAKWMREHRKNPSVRASELRQQGEYRAANIEKRRTYARSYYHRRRQQEASQ